MMKSTTTTNTTAKSIATTTTANSKVSSRLFQPTAASRAKMAGKSNTNSTTAATTGNVNHTGNHTFSSRSSLKSSISSLIHNNNNVTSTSRPSSAGSNRSPSSPSLVNKKKPVMLSKVDSAKDLLMPLENEIKDLKNQVAAVQLENKKLVEEKQHRQQLLFDSQQKQQTEEELQTLLHVRQEFDLLEKKHLALNEKFDASKEEWSQHQTFLESKIEKLELLRSSAISNLQDKVNELEKEKQGWYQEKSALQEALTTAAAATATVTANDTSANDTENNSSEYQSKVQHLELELDNLREANKHLVSELQRLEEEKETKETENDLEADNSVLRSSIEELEQVNEELSTILKNEKAALATALEQLEQERAAHTASKQQTESELYSRNAVKEELQDEKTAHAATKQQLVQLSEKMTKMESSKSAQDERTEALTGEVKQLHEDISEMSAALESMEEIKLEFENKVLTLEDENKKLVDQVKNETMVAEELKTEFESKLTILQIEHLELKTQLENTQLVSEEKQIQEDQLSAAKDTILELERTLKSVEIELQQTKSEYIAEKKNIEVIQNRMDLAIRPLAEENEKLKRDLEEALAAQSQQQHDDVDHNELQEEMLRELENAQTELSKLRKQVGEDSQVIDLKDERLSELTEHVENLKQQLDEVRDAYIMTQEEIASMRRLNEQLQAQVQESTANVEKLGQICDNLNVSNADKSSKLAAAYGDLEDVRATLEGTESELVQSKLMIADLTAKLEPSQNLMRRQEDQQPKSMSPAFDGVHGTRNKEVNDEEEHIFLIQSQQLDGLKGIIQEQTEELEQQRKRNQDLVQQVDDFRGTIVELREQLGLSE